MALGNAHDLTKEFKQNIYHIELDVSGWDTVTIQAIGSVAGIASIYGTINDGMPQGSLLPSNNYGASLARDWSAVQATNLATGSGVTTFSAAGMYSVPVKFPYLRIAGGGDIYALWQFNSKVS